MRSKEINSAIAGRIIGETTSADEEIIERWKKEDLKHSFILDILSNPACRLNKENLLNRIKKGMTDPEFKEQQRKELTKK
jgi:hypothetical protein